MCREIFRFSSGDPSPLLPYPPILFYVLFQRLSHNSLHAAEPFIPLIPSVIAIVIAVMIVVMIVLVIVMMVLVIIKMVMPLPFRLTLQSLSSPLPWASPSSLSLLLSSSLVVPAGLYSSALRDSPSWLRISAWGDDPSRAASRIARMASSSNVRIPSRTLFEKYLTLLFVSLRQLGERLFSALPNLFGLLSRRMMIRPEI